MLLPRRPLVACLLLLLVAACASAPPQPAGTAPGDAPYNVMGRADAPVTIIEFSDLQCPYCARYALDIFPEVERNYIATGKVRYAVREFPLPMHPYAMPAAIAVRCAGAQGRFWEYREALFGGQARLASAPYDELAGRLGLDVKQFATCRADPEQAAAIRREVALAKSQGIASTPSFVIGRMVDGRFQGLTFSGAETYPKFAARIDALMPAGP
jgi:protein-disulfide isomerase